MRYLWLWPLGSCGSSGNVVPDPCGQHTGDTLAQIALKLCHTCVSMMLLPNEPVSLWAGVTGVVKTACNLQHFKQSKRRACSIYSPFKALWGDQIIIMITVCQDAEWLWRRWWALIFYSLTPMQTEDRPQSSTTAGTASICFPLLPSHEQDNGPIRKFSEKDQQLKV